MNNILDKPNLDTIRSRYEAATPPPWTSLLYDSDDDLWEVAPVAYGQDYGIFDKADAEFVAHARDDVPALIAEIERLRSALESEHE